jgi:hypothetical protein
MTDLSGNEPGAKELATRWLTMIQSGDFTNAAEILDENFVAEWPQTRERVRGLKNLVAMMEHFPGGNVNTRVETARLTESTEAHYLMTPMFTTIKVEGSGNRATGHVLTRYPDGTDWYVVLSIETRGGKIIHNTAFFAPVYDAPKWRAQWVEHMGDSE